MWNRNHSNWKSLRSLVIQILTRYWKLNVWSNVALACINTIIIVALACINTILACINTIIIGCINTIIIGGPICHIGWCTIGWPIIVWSNVALPWWLNLLPHIILACIFIFIWCWRLFFICIWKHLFCKILWMVAWVKILYLVLYYSGFDTY